MDPFSLALGVLAVVQTTASAVETLYDFAKTVQHAPDEIQSLAREANSLYGVLRRINEALMDPTIQAYIAKHPDVERDLASLREPLQQCERRIGTVMVSLEKLTDHGPDGGRTFKRYRWPFEKGEVSAARSELGQARESATFAFTGLNFVDNLRNNAKRESLGGGTPDASRSPSRARVEDLQRRDVDLRKAAKDNNVEIIRLLLDDKAPVDSKDDEGRTPLSFAAESGSIDAVELLLERKAFVNTASNEIAGNWFKRAQGTRTPLHWAAVGGHIIVIEKLLNAGADIEAKTNGQWTPIMAAANSGHYKTVRFLLERKANFNARTYRNWSTLHIAASIGRADIAELLIDHGVDVEVMYTGTQGESGEPMKRRPLHVAVQNSSKWSVEDTTKMVELLVQKGKALISAPDSHGWTALHYAVHYKSRAALRVLMEHATVADLAIKTSVSGNHTVLDFAQSSGNNELIELIEKGLAPAKPASDP